MAVENEEDAAKAVEAIALPTPNAAGAANFDKEFAALFGDWREVQDGEMLRAGMPYLHRSGSFISVRLTGVFKDVKHTKADARRWVKDTTE